MGEQRHRRRALQSADTFRLTRDSRSRSYCRLLPGIVFKRGGAEDAETGKTEGRRAEATLN